MSARIVQPPAPTAYRPDRTAGSVLSRRHVLAGGCMAAASFTLASQAQSNGSATMGVVDTLMERNQAFSKTRFRPDLKILPSLKTIIIGCVDPRVDPAEIFALQPGEAVIIRNVGGRVFPSTTATLDMLSMVSRASGGQLGDGWNIVLLHHTDCGIKRLSQSPQLLADHFGVPASGLAGLAIMDPAASVVVDVTALRADARLSRELTVSGLVYDVATGRTVTVVPPARLG